MANPFKKRISQYLYFIKKDRNAIIILSVLILILIAANFLIKRITFKSDYDYSQFMRIAEELENNNAVNEAIPKVLFSFNPNSITEQKMDSLDIPEFIKQNLISYRKAGGAFSQPEDLQKIYGMNDSIFAIIKPYIEIHNKVKNDTKKIVFEKPFPVIEGYFDPNTADAQALMQFGFSQYQSDNLIKYRNSGGFFQTKTDLLKIYGIDSVFLARIENNIHIEPVIENNPVEPESVLVIELNSADTADLMKLDGIGPVFARRILKYRDLLGGYYSKTQLTEVFNFPVETFQLVRKNIRIDTSSIQKIRINYAEFSDLAGHPYMDKKIANALLKHRDKNGAFKAAEQLKSVAEIDSLAYVRIRPYITCR